MLNLFKKKKQVKKAATAADFNNSGIGMALKVMPFLPLLLLLISFAVQAMDKPSDNIREFKTESVEETNDPYTEAFISMVDGTSFVPSSVIRKARAQGFTYSEDTDDQGRREHNFTKGRTYVSITMRYGTEIHSIYKSWSGTSYSFFQTKKDLFNKNSNNVRRVYELPGEVVLATIGGYNFYAGYESGHTYVMVFNK